MFFAVPDKNDGRKNQNIKGREPLAFKVENQKVFRQAINELFEMIDNGEFTSDPISWNLYRKLNGIKLDYHGYGNDIFNTNGDFIAIDDYTTDIDCKADISKLELLLKEMKGGFKMVKVKATETFYLAKFNELKNIKRASVEEEGKLFANDIFECTEPMYEYLTGKNALERSFVELIEYIPETPVETIEKPIENNEETPVEEKPKTRRRKKII